VTEERRITGVEYKREIFEVQIPGRHQYLKQASSKISPLQAEG
jgi:hypothetical protein